MSGVFPSITGAGRPTALSVPSSERAGRASPLTTIGPNAGASAAAVSRLAAYIRRLASALAVQPVAALIEGHVDLPDPAAIVPAVEQA